MPVFTFAIGFYTAAICSFHDSIEPHLLQVFRFGFGFSWSGPLLLVHRLFAHSVGILSDLNPAAFLWPPPPNFLATALTSKSPRLRRL